MRKAVCFSSVLLSTSCFLAQKMFSFKKNTVIVTEGRTHASVNPRARQGSLLHITSLNF